MFPNKKNGRREGEQKHTVDWMRCEKDENLTTTNHFFNPKMNNGYEYTFHLDSLFLFSVSYIFEIIKFAERIFERIKFSIWHFFNFEVFGKNCPIAHSSQFLTMKIFGHRIFNHFAPYIFLYYRIPYPTVQTSEHDVKL